MPLFDKKSFIDETGTNVLQRMEDFYQDATSLNIQQQAEADTDMRFYTGDQSVYNEQYGNLTVGNRRQFQFNIIRPQIEMVAGHQRDNRRSVAVVPRENASQDTADQFTKLLKWNFDKDRVNEKISDAFTGALITGMNLLQIWVDYRKDPLSGEIKLTNRGYNSFIIDPFFKELDLSDCQAVWTRTYLSRLEIASLLPNEANDININSAVGNKDGKFYFMPEAYDWNVRNLVAYDEFFYKDYRKQKRLIDVETGQTMEWKGDNEMLKLYLQTYPDVVVDESYVPTVRQAIVVDGKVMFNGPNTTGIDAYPFVPVVSYFQPEVPYFNYRIQGMVRGLRDPQFLYNRRKVTEFDIVESQLNSGYIAKEDAVVDPKSLYKTGQGQVVWLKSEAAMTDVQPIQAPQIPPSLFQLSQDMKDITYSISGVNEELLGAATDDKAGILAQLRQGAGLKTLRRLFDQLDLAQRILATRYMEIIQNNMMPGKVKQIIDAEPTPEFYDHTFGVYDAVVEDGFDTATQRQLQFAQLLHLREVGLDIPPDVLINAATVQNKTELIEAIQKQQQEAQQAQQAQQQSAIQQQQAATELAQARAQADMGLANERNSRIDENRALAVERLAEANKDDEMAVLNKIKAIKELASIDLEQLESLLRLQESAKRQEIEAAAGRGLNVFQNQQSPQGLGQEQGLGALSQLGPVQEPGVGQQFNG